MHTLWLRQSCSGGAYYVCHSGFKGCCSIDPCGPGSSCPDSSSTITFTSQSTPTSLTTTSTSYLTEPSAQTALPSSTISLVVSTSTSSSVQSVSSAATKSSSASSLSTLSTAQVAAATTTLPTSSSSTSVLSNAAYTAVLSCPAANGTRFTDAGKSQYNIHCDQDNSQPSFSTVLFDSGGFSQCFASCDDVTACAGFSFVGSDGGSCYLKDQMPESGYTATAGSNYVSCERLAVSSDTRNSSKAVIAGAAAGGALALVLLSLAIAFCARRRRKRIEETRAATLESTYSGAAEGPGGGELFAPYGGFYRDGVLASREASYSANKTSKEQKYKHETTLRDERQPLTYTYEDGPAQLDGIPVYSNSEHKEIAELDGTSTAATYKPKHQLLDASPVLGQRRQDTLKSHTATSHLRSHRHMMSWNNYDVEEAAAPPSTMSSGLSTDRSSPDVSPIPRSTEWTTIAHVSSQTGGILHSGAGDRAGQEKVSPLLPGSGLLGCRDYT